MGDVVWNETEGQVQDRLRAQVARLEGELRWCIRGLEDAANARPEHLVDWVANLNLERLEYARAALSPDAGKGWLPPEVRERIWHDLGEPAACYHVLTRHPGPFCECEYPVCVLARAALDALKGVE